MSNIGQREQGFFKDTSRGTELSKHAENFRDHGKKGKGGQGNDEAEKNETI